MIGQRSRQVGQIRHASKRGALAALGLICGCSTSNDRLPGRPGPAVTVETAAEWEGNVSLADLERLKGLNAAWAEALTEAEKAGFRKAMAAEGKLLQPSGSSLRPAPPPGSYICRLFQLGSTSARVRPFAASKPSFCYVGVEDDDSLWLSKQTGIQRRQGYLWDDKLNGRLVFLGSIARGTEKVPPPYGTAPGQDAAGVLDRIGPLRYRLVIPRPAGTYKLEVLELTPAPVQHEED